MKKRWLFTTLLAAAICVICLALFPTEAKAVTIGALTYHFVDGEAIITDCDESVSGEIFIPDTLGDYPVTTIAEGAFCACDNLVSITGGKNITTIGDYAFEGCLNLTSFTIPSGVTSIGFAVFRFCDFSSITIPDGVTSIGDAAFEHCSNLTSITIPDSVTEIGVSAFLQCTSLANVIIGNGLTTIDIGVFARCSELTSITIGSGVTSIKDRAFEGCYNLETVYIRGNRSEEQSIAVHGDNKCCINAQWYWNACIGSVTHTYDNACDANCNVCDSIRAITHNYKDATCITPKTCKVCGATSGKALGHTYKTTTTKATFAKNGSIVKKCSVCGVVASNKAIRYVKTVKLSATSYVYNGKVKTPSVTVKDSAGKTLVKGTDYTVTYQSGRKAAGTYKVVITLKGKYSGTKTLTFKILPAAKVATQPKTQNVEAGEKVKFTVKATGTGLKYQWQVSSNGKTWKNCSSSSAKKATFTFTGKTSHDGNYYRCKVTDSAGNTVYTSKVRAYVLGIEEQPVKKTVTKGKTAKFIVEATGHSLTYQWQYSTDGGKTWKNCSSSSAKKAIFSFTAKISHNGYYYRCRITDSAGNRVYTSKVKLTVKK